ncbi:recombinase RecT [Methylococcus mesophilus]|uniref:recombinase RecT n=1 Tax=Methylococcus mesophilus TaxID=2993564 RepID=UPI00224AFD4C|nr:recombinase RecT [Methylococcus mesophilus]UZR29037.1 recombinase RecT [Methylococcus mesophilus]
MATSVAELKNRTAPPTRRDIAALPKEKQLPAMLESFKGEIQRALPRHLNPDRMCRIALTEFRKNPKLAQCEPASVFAAIIQASQLGLEPGLMGQAYLIPYGQQCQLIPGYQGLIDLVRRSGLIKRIEAHVVRDGDRFTYRTGLTTVLEHEPALDGEPGDLRLAYAVAEFSDGGCHVEVMTRAQIEAIRDRSQNVQSARKWKKETPWDTDTEEMWRKTAIRRICKYLPKSAELATAVALDDAAAQGGQSLSVDDAIDGTWTPAEASDTPVVRSVETVDTETGEIVQETAAPPAALPSPAVADWLAAIESFTTKPEIARAVKDIREDNRLSADEHSELLRALASRQEALKSP